MPSGAIQAEVVAPQLAAFHRQFQVAIRQRRTIFEDRSVYDNVFPKEISAEHVYLVQSLAEAVTQSKIDLQERIESGIANAPEQAAGDFLGYSTSKFFVVAVCGWLAEQILGRPIPDLFTWGVNAARVRQDRSDIVARWKVVVDGIVPVIVSHAGDDVYETVRSATEIDQVANKVGFMLQSLKDQYASTMSPIRDVTELK